MITIARISGERQAFARQLVVGMLFGMAVDYNSAMTTSPFPELETMIRAACVLEATARKPGNVHPHASFVDLSYADFISAADIVAPVLARAPEIGIGGAILEAVRETQHALGRNVNLGIILLIAPLAAVPLELTLAAGIGEVLGKLTQRDAELVYEAIRLANPGGMGSVEEQDVSRPPTGTLLDVMQLASARDQIATEYVGGFRAVLEHAAAHFPTPLNCLADWERSIIHLQLKLLARHGDSLIARKCGNETSDGAKRRAQTVLRTFEESPTALTTELAKFDEWLRGDGHRRNPGTTADLVAAILFAAMRDGFVALPSDDFLDQLIRENS